MGRWVQKSDTLWVYHVQGGALIYGYVARHRGIGPPDATWDAVVAGLRSPDDVTLTTRVSLEEAQRAIAEHAAAHVDVGEP